MKRKGVNGLAEVFTRQTNEPGVAALELVDGHGRSFAAAIDAHGVDLDEDVTVKDVKQAIADALLKITGLSRLYERSDANVRSLEGLPEVTGWLRGEGATEVTIREHAWQLTLDVASGHKTGFYLDQRDNRALASQLAAGAEVLNAFCYTGGFTLAALKGGAKRVESIDTSEEALAQALMEGEALGLKTHLGAGPGDSALQAQFHRQIEDHGAGHDRYYLAGSAHRDPVIVFLEPAHHSVGRGKSVGTTAGQQHGIDLLDRMARVEQIGLAGAGGGAAHIHCGGCVTIGNGGALEGVIHAKSISIEKGGIRFQGTMQELSANAEVQAQYLAV